jgi:hypothetical protein
MISELLALVLPEEMQLLYRQKRCGRHRHTLSCFSWSCSAEPFQPATVQLKCETPRMTTRMRPCSPQDEWRTHFALPKTMRLTSTRHCSDAVSLPASMLSALPQQAVVDPNRVVDSWIEDMLIAHDLLVNDRDFYIQGPRLPKPYPSPSPATHSFSSRPYATHLPNRCGKRKRHPSSLQSMDLNMDATSQPPNLLLRLLQRELRQRSRLQRAPRKRSRIKPRKMFKRKGMKSVNLNVYVTHVQPLQHRLKRDQVRVL